jgi:serine phosphatase RsbU (regulator of sigma subunit)
LSWIVAVQRLATLCSQCKQAVPPTPSQLAELQRRYPQLVNLQKGPLFEARGCANCHYTGRDGDVAAFDIFRAEANGPDIFRQPSLLPLERYVMELAMAGYLALDDLLNLETDQLRRTYNLLTASEHALSEANTALQRKLVELEASNQVLQQRTKALISLQGIGQALITIVGLKDLAQRICRYTRELCSADRVILYYLCAADIAEVLAFSGWPPARVPQEVEAALVFNPDVDINTEPSVFDGWPPGIPPRHPDVEGAILKAGLRVPLVTQDRLVGVMIVHSTQKSSFQPDEAALLQTFAYQAAVAIQRAGLIEELRDKITQLEAAQVELVKKERMEQELELARRVQQSVLPRTFPQIPGCQFAAYNEPARRVGGDFYDVISLDPDHCGVVIADVSDKGMPAALYMALTRSLILAEARRERSPRAVLLNINQLLLELGEPGMFVTVFYGVIEKATRRMTYARAGHDYPLLLRDGTIQELGGEGTLLGFLDRAELHLSEETILLNPHDRLVLYTDGLTDVLSPDGERFALNRLKTLCQTHVNLPPAEFCSAVFAGLNAYQGGAEQFDDMTLLVIDVKRT